MKAFKFIAIFLLLIVIYNLSLFLVSLLPKTESLYNNCLSSSITLKEEGEFYIPLYVEGLDNNTDALIVNEIYSVDNTNPLDSYLLVRKSYDKELTKHIVSDQYGNLSTFSLNIIDDNGNPIPDSQFNIFSQCKELYKFLKGEINISTEYARYWHGYLIIFRPLLYIFNISFIRIFLVILFLLLFLLLIKHLNKIFNTPIVVSFGASILCCGMFTASASFQQAPLLFLIIISSLILLKNIDKMNNTNFAINIFFVGSVACFFDYLTTPLLSFICPTILFILYCKKQYNNPRKNFFMIIVFLISWGLGYGFTWLIKWIIVNVVLHRNIIESAFSQVLFRMNGNLDNWDNLGNNYNKLLSNTAEYILFTLIAVIVIEIICAKKKRSKRVSLKAFIKTNYDIITFGVISLLWMIITHNHIIVHPNYTIKNIFPIVFILIYYIGFKRSLSEVDEFKEN